MYYIIVNNQCRKGLKAWLKVETILRKKEITYKAFFISQTYDLQQLKINILDEKTSALVIIGGDGTIHYALQYIKDTDIPLAIIPAGSGNDFARALNIPKKTKAALMKVLQGNSRKVDLINVNGQAAATIVGIGFDAKITEITNKSKFKQWLNMIHLGSFSYVIGMLRALFSYEPSNIDIEIDGKRETFYNVWLIACANTAFYGGGLKICPEANEQDGIFNLCIVHSMSRFELLCFFPLVFLGKHTLHRNVEVKSARTIHINCDKAVPVQVDGELIGKTPITLTIQKQQLHVIA